MADQVRTDTCAWRLIWAWTGLAAVFAAQMKALEFLPSMPPKAGIAFGARLALDLALPFIFLCLCGFAIWLVAGAVLALIKRRVRRGLSFIFAIIAIPLLFVMQARLNMFDPYYWYVLANVASFETQAKSISRAGAVAFAVVETRDVSIGIVTAPPRYASIVYDESDEIGLDPADRSADWRVRNQARLEPATAGYLEPWLSVKHLVGHFFLLRAGG
ncbi:MAG: hypothetical protein ACLPPF_13870 [Rhodomicrobium sp.]